MFEWSFLNFLWIIVASICAGFGWIIGGQLAADTAVPVLAQRTWAILLIVVIVVLLIVFAPHFR